MPLEDWAGAAQTRTANARSGVSSATGWSRTSSDGSSTSVSDCSASPETWLPQRARAVICPVRKQQFARRQDDLLVGPENTIAHAVRHVHARAAGHESTGAAILKAGEVAGDDVVARCFLAKVVRIPYSAGNDRIGINPALPGWGSPRTRLRRDQGQIAADVATRPKRFGQQLSGVHGGKPEMPGSALPASGRQQEQHTGREQGSLDPQTPPIPGTPFANFFPDNRAAQTRSYLFRDLGWQWESQPGRGMPGSNTGLPGGAIQVLSPTCAEV